MRCTATEMTLSKKQTSTTPTYLTINFKLLQWTWTATTSNRSHIYSSIGSIIKYIIKPTKRVWEPLSTHTLNLTNWIWHVELLYGIEKLYSPQFLPLWHQVLKRRKRKRRHKKFSAQGHAMGRCRCRHHRHHHLHHHQSEITALPAWWVEPMNRVARDKERLDDPEGVYCCSSSSSTSLFSDKSEMSLNYGGGRGASLWKSCVLPKLLDLQLSLVGLSRNVGAGREDGLDNPR